MKLNPIYVRRFLKTYSFSEHEKMYHECARHNNATEWDKDDFVSFIEINLDTQDNLDAAIATIFGIARYDMVENYNLFGSGYNDNINWNKYQNWRGALYDVWAEVQTHLK